MNNKLMALYNRTLRNCEFYEKENDISGLLSEIGCLRGIAYCLEEFGVDTLSLPGLLRYIEVSNTIKKCGITMTKYRVKEECADVFLVVRILTI